jgi:hypothetical protein
MRLTTFVALSILGWAGGAAARPDALLPVRVSGLARTEVDTAVADVLGQVGPGRLLAPSTLVVRLARDPRVAQVLSAARREIEEAEAATLQMERGRAVKAARRGLGMLRSVAASEHSPDIAARSHVALALALMLEPADMKGAQAAFVRALQIVPDLVPDRDRFSPRAREVLGRARLGCCPLPSPPAPREMALLARQARVERVIWIGVTGERRDTVRLSLVVHDSRQRTERRRRTELVPAARLSEALGSTIRSALSDLDGAPPSSRPSSVQAEPRPRPRKAGSRTPWYRTWWPWAAAAVAAVLAGVAIGVAVDQASQPEPDFSLHVRF